MNHPQNRRDRGRPARRGPKAGPPFGPELLFDLDLDQGADDSPGRHAKPDHKTAQLCRQVERLLALVLPACADPAVRGLTVLGVVPAPDAGHLLVRVAAPFAGGARGIARVLERLDAAGPFLRRELAAGITRKRVPELSFLPVLGGRAAGAGAGAPLTGGPGAGPEGGVR